MLGVQLVDRKGIDEVSEVKREIRSNRLKKVKELRVGRASG